MARGGRGVLPPHLGRARGRRPRDRGRLAAAPEDGAPGPRRGERFDPPCRRADSRAHLPDPRGACSRRRRPPGPTSRSTCRRSRPRASWRPTRPRSGSGSTPSSGSSACGRCSSAPAARSRSSRRWRPGVSRRSYRLRAHEGNVHSPNERMPLAYLPLGVGPPPRSSAVSRPWLALRSPRRRGELAEDVLERFLRYVRSTPRRRGRRRLPEHGEAARPSRLLVEELRELGLDDAELTEHGYVFATLPGTPGAPVIGLIAHVDTTPETPGRRRRRRSCTRTTPASRSSCPAIRARCSIPADEPALPARVGHDIVTSDGTTLLGADDKAGVAEIMAAVAYLAARPSRARPSASRSRSTRRSAAAPTTSTSRRSAPWPPTRSTARASARSRSRRSRPGSEGTIRGRGAHPGSAKGKLVNAIKLAADFVAVAAAGCALARDHRGS